VVRYLVYLINMFRPEDDPFAFTKVQFWAVYSGGQGGGAGRRCLLSAVRFGREACSRVGGA